MGIVHLKGSMLVEYLGGRLDDPSIRRHVEGCELCKARLRDDRLLRAMCGPGGAGASGDHLDDETLAAYFDQGLEPSRMRAVDRHLAHCDACLADYLALKKLVATSPRAPVPPDLRERAIEALGTRTLGTLYLSMQGNRVLAFFLAEAAHDAAISYRGAEDAPAGRARFSQRLDPRESGFVAESSREPRESKMAASMDPDRRFADDFIDAGGGAGNHVVIDVDESLSLEAAAAEATLEVRAVDPASGEPRAGVVVRFEYGEHGGYVQETDEKGHAAGKLPPADVPARIVLPGPPSRVIDIQLS